MKTAINKIITPIFVHATLAGNTEFYYAFEQGKLLLKFGKMSNFLPVKNEIIYAVHERINQLKTTEKGIYKTTTSLYNQPKWKDCPNNRFSVYVASLLIHNKIKF
jgi:hypothetical protein